MGLRWGRVVRIGRRRVWLLLKGMQDEGACRGGMMAGLMMRGERRFCGHADVAAEDGLGGTAAAFARLADEEGEGPHRLDMVGR